MAGESIAQKIDSFFKAIELCASSRFRVPTLILLYSVIDIVSWLHSNDQSVKTRFTIWVEKYLLPGSKLTCSSLDLYAARCGVVHTSSSESDLSKMGKAKQIFYAWAPSHVSELETLIKLKATLAERLGTIEKEDIIAVQFEDLLAATRHGIEQFDRDLSQADEPTKVAVNTKAARFFGDVSSKDVTEMISMAKEALRE